MVKAIWEYLQDDVWPRWAEILLSLEMLLSLVAGFAVVFFCGGMDEATRGAIVSAALSYASIAFGFCIAGMTIALTLPDREFARTLAAAKPPGQGADSYSALLFVFSWTAVVHWVAILFLILALILPKTSIPAMVPEWTGKAFLGITGAVLAQGLIQFLLTVITLAQVGKAYIKHLSGEDDAMRHKSPARRRRGI